MAIKSFTLIEKESCFGVRHIQVLLLFIYVSLAFYTRINASISIVAITNANTTNPNFSELDWSEKEKSYILSSFFWGCLCSQFLGGYVSGQFGTKELFLGCNLFDTVLNFSTPTAIIYGGWQLFLAIQFLHGVMQSVTLPSVYMHLAKWCPVDERNRLGGITNAGIEFGHILGFAVSGLVATSDLGWPGIFYITGIIEILWSILWVYFGSNSPSDSKIISLAEKETIQTSLGESVSVSNRKKVVPWKAIFTSVAFWALTVVRGSLAMSSFTLAQQAPTYIHGVFKLGIADNGIYSAVPYIIPFILSFVVIIPADVLTNRYNVHLATLRKTYNSIACWVPAIALLVLGCVDVDLALSVTLLIIALSVCSAQVIGSCMNHVDLSPNNSGVLFGITNTLASLVGTLSPILIEAIVVDDSNPAQWSVVFITIAVILFFGNLFYVIFGKMEEQSWNACPDEKS